MRTIVSLATRILPSLLAIFLLSAAFDWWLDYLDGPGYQILVIASNLAFSVLVFFLVRWFNKRYNQLLPGEYGFTCRLFPRKVTTGILFTVLVIGTTLLIAAPLGIHTLISRLEKGAGLPLLELLAGNWAIGAWEEIYFRGLVFITLLRVTHRFWIAALISGTLFAALHTGTYDLSQTTAFWFVEVMLLSYVLLHLYVFTRSIWTPVAFHFSWDFTWDLLNDSENEVGIIKVSQYAAHAKLLDHISIMVLGVCLAVIIYAARRKNEDMLQGDPSPAYFPF